MFSTKIHVDLKHCLTCLDHSLRNASFLIIVTQACSLDTGVPTGVEWSGAEWTGVEWSGVEWSEVKWSGVEWRGEGLIGTPGKLGWPLLVPRQKSGCVVPDKLCALWYACRLCTCLRMFEDTCRSVHPCESVRACKCVRAGRQAG